MATLWVSYGERKGISALVKANRPIREDECPFRLPASETRTPRPYNTFSCMISDFWCMMPSGWVNIHKLYIIHQTSYIIKTPFVLSSFQYFKIDFTYKENFLIIYIIKNISIEYFFIFKQLNDWKGERKEVSFSELIYSQLFITSVEKFLIKKCQFFRQLANACLPLQPRKYKPLNQPKVCR